MEEQDTNRKTVRETRYGCFIEMVLFALFMGLIVHFIRTIISNIG